MRIAWSSVSCHAWCRKHTSVRRRRGVTISRSRLADTDHGDLPAGKLVERIEKVLRGPPPLRQLGDQNGVDPASLCELEEALLQKSA